MSKKRNRGANYWQSEAMDSRVYAGYLDFLLSLAMNRFRWVNLPETCDERYLERTLHMYGCATICHPTDAPDWWESLKAIAFGKYDAYGVPVKWRGVGFQGTGYDVTPENGEIVYYSQTRTNPWNMLSIFASKLERYSRTEDVNLTHQQKPWVLIAPQEKRQELINIYKQIAGFEPAILGNKSTWETVDSIKAIDTGVPFIGEDLARAKQNVLFDCLLYLGIPHLSFEKGERMIENEVTANTAATSMMLMDCLSARRRAAEKLNRRFGLDIEVYFNDDLESLNFNYVNNIEAQAQDGLIGGADDGQPADLD